MKKITQEVRHRTKIYAGFLIIGTCMALWGISIPYIKSRLNIDDLNLGTILMFLSICNSKLSIYTGFIIAGLGAANIIPACISMVDAAKGSMSFNAAIAAVTTIGYSGTLLGPVIIGYISHISNLLAAFIFIYTALILTGIFSLILKEK